MDKHLRRVQLCRNFPACVRPACAYAHTLRYLRKPPAKYRTARTDYPMGDGVCTALFYLYLAEEDRLGIVPERFQCYVQPKGRERSRSPHKKEAMLCSPESSKVDAWCPWARVRLIYEIITRWAIEISGAAIDEVPKVDASLSIERLVDKAEVFLEHWLHLSGEVECEEAMTQDARPGDIIARLDFIERSLSLWMRLRSVSHSDWQQSSRLSA